MLVTRGLTGRRPVPSPRGRRQELNRGIRLVPLSLDPESASVVLETLHAVARTGVAVVASLHQVHLATSYADRIIALRAGRVAENAPKDSSDVRALEQIYARDAQIRSAA